jgi:hypothetical protein
MPRLSLRHRDSCLAEAQLPSEGNEQISKISGCYARGVIASKERAFHSDKKARSMVEVRQETFLTPPQKQSLSFLTEERYFEEYIEIGLNNEQLESMEARETG